MPRLLTKFHRLAANVPHTNACATVSIVSRWAHEVVFGPPNARHLHILVSPRPLCSVTLTSRPGMKQPPWLTKSCLHDWDSGHALITSAVSRWPGKHSGNVTHGRAQGRPLRSLIQMVRPPGRGEVSSTLYMKSWVKQMCRATSLSVAADFWYFFQPSLIMPACHSSRSLRRCTGGRDWRLQRSGAWWCSG